MTSKSLTSQQASKFRHSAELCDDDNLADDGLVEGGQAFGWNPIFLVLPAARLLDLVILEEAALHLEARHEAGAVGLDVPVPRDLDGVALGQDRVEDRLLGKAGREGAEAALFDEPQ